MPEFIRLCGIEFETLHGVLGHVVRESTLSHCRDIGGKEKTATNPDFECTPQLPACRPDMQAIRNLAHVSGSSNATQEQMPRLRKTVECSQLGVTFLYESQPSMERISEARRPTKFTDVQPAERADFLFPRADFLSPLVLADVLAPALKSHHCR